MVYMPNVSCSETLTKTWTPSAIDCYLLGCNCSSCYLNKLYFKNNSSKCMMKYTVIELVRRLGAPKTSAGEEK